MCKFLYEIGAGPAVLGVNNNGQVAYFPFQVGTAAPGIFMTADGNQSLVPSASGSAGQELVAFVTGQGDVTPALITGEPPAIVALNKLPAPSLPMTITV